MASPINLPGVLLAAQAISYAKGHELNRENSKDKQENARLYRQALQQHQELLTQKKATDTAKGRLA